MDWLTALKGLFSGKFNGVIKTHKERNIDSHDINNQPSLVVNGNLTVFNFHANEQGLLPEDQIKQLQSVLLPQFKNSNVLFLQEESQELVGGYNQFRNSPEIKDLLAFFEDKISQMDMTLLESGLYEAHLIETGQREKAQDLKSNIIMRYPVRSKNIFNLASGGFFSSQIKPLYEALSLQEDFQKSQFDKEYEQIVSELPFAIFVHNGISDDDVRDMLAEKAERNIRYGVKEEAIVINGFGTNAERIELMIPELSKTYRRIAPNVYYMGELRCIQLSIYYRESNKSTLND